MFFKTDQIHKLNKNYKFLPGLANVDVKFVEQKIIMLNRIPTTMTLMPLIKTVSIWL